MKSNKENSSEVKLLIIVLAFAAFGFMMLGIIAEVLLLGIVD